MAASIPRHDYHSALFLVGTYDDYFYVLNTTGILHLQCEHRYVTHFTVHTHTEFLDVEHVFQCFWSDPKTRVFECFFGSASWSEMVKMFFSVFGQTPKHLFLSAFLRFCTVFAIWD